MFNRLWSFIKSLLKPQQPTPAPEPVPQLTDEQICYAFVNYLSKRYEGGLWIADINTFPAAIHWASNGRSLIDLIDVFAGDKKLLRMDYGDGVVYPTELSLCPDDSTFANMKIAELCQMQISQRNKKIVRTGEDDDLISVNELLEDLQQPTIPLRAILWLNLQRLGEERVRKAKAVGMI